MKLLYLTIISFLMMSFPVKAAPYLTVVAPEDTPRNQTIIVYQVQFKDRSGAILYDSATSGNFTYTPTYCTATKVCIDPPTPLPTDLPEGYHFCWLLLDYANIALSDGYYFVTTRAQNEIDWSEWSDSRGFEVVNGNFYRVGRPTNFMVEAMPR